MPTIGVKRDLLFSVLRDPKKGSPVQYTDEEFSNLCFEFGLELDEVTSEKQMISKEQGAGAEQSKDASDEVLYRIDIPANRYDLLCLEGLARGLNIFLESMSAPKYTRVEPLNPEEAVLTILPDTAKIRQYAVAAILRGVTLDADRYASFIDLQDKLHQNIGRKRSLVSIGTHDLDTVKGPFIYDARLPENIKFVPLNHNKELTAAGVMDLLSNHMQLKAYLPIIRDSPVYPVIYDKNGVVLSLPPIINGDHSKITLKTKNIFIEITATDHTKANVALDTIVCMFSEYCEKPFTVETVKVVYAEDERTEICPHLPYTTYNINSKKANRYIGTQLADGRMKSLLRKMSLEVGGHKDKITVTVPPTRHDIIHACDIYEDIAIAHGYNNIQKTVPKVSTVGREVPINKLTDLLRESVANVGFTEALTFALCSRDDISTKLGKNLDGKEVHISNPKTLEFQVARTTLLPGLLKTLFSNKHLPLPIKLFEISDVVLQTNKGVGAKNERRLCALNCNKTAGFEIVHGLLDRVMLLLEIPFSEDHKKCGYYLRPADDPTYFPGRCADIVVRKEVLSSVKEVVSGRSSASIKEFVIGRLGALHPDVLTRFEITNPCSAIEIIIEDFV